MSVGQLLPLCSSDPMKYGEFGFGSKSGVKEPDCGLVRDMNLVGESMVLVVFWVQTCIRRKYRKNTDWRHSWFFSSQARCSIQMSKRVSTKYTFSGPCSPPIICRRRILIIAWDGKLALAISFSNRKMPFLTTLDILRYLWMSISWILLTICCKLSRDAIMRQLNQAWAVSDSELNK